MKKENILNLKEVNYPYSPLYDRIQRKNKNEYNHNEEMNTRSNFSTISENSENNLGSKFSQMRNEISLLQNKIESIEKMISMTIICIIILATTFLTFDASGFFSS